MLRNRWADLDFSTDYQRLAPYVGHLTRIFTVPLSTVLLDQAIAIAAFPGELFVENQLDLRRRAPVRDVLFAGYTNGYYGYFPTIDAAATGGYGANDVMSSAEIGAGELLVNHALILMNSALGKLRREPVPPGQSYRSTGPVRK